MNIADSILKHHLEHVYWINGGPCGGKTTTAQKLSAKHGFAVFDSGKHIQRYQQNASFHDHPALLRPFIDWEWFFNRPIDVYARWLSDFNHEVAEWAIADLLELPGTSPVAAEQDFADASLLRRISTHRRVVFLFADDELIEKELLHRDDHEPIRRMISEHTTDPAASERNVVAVATELSHRMQAEALAHEHFVHVRTHARPDQDFLPLVEQHFAL
jgi:adenylate kinase family enzyme